MNSKACELSQQNIVEAASIKTGGLLDFGDLPFLDRMDRLLNSIEQEAKLNSFGRASARDRLISHTSNRLLYVEDRKRYADIPLQQISKPIFIIGLPRTGTTILQDILSQDPSSRAPMTWECMFPSPPPQRETYEIDSRIKACQATFPASHPTLDAMHPMGALHSQECVVLMCESMCSPIFHMQYNIPSYQDWFDSGAGLASLYQFHKRQLQHLQSGYHNRHWILKAWAHMWGIEHLLKCYPDARIIFTHRDPTKVLSSFASMTTYIRSLSSDEVNPLAVASDWTNRLHRAMDHMMDIRDDSQYTSTHFYDMCFSDFVNDPFKEIEKIYQSLDLELSGLAADRIKHFIDNNPRNKHGGHQYVAEDYGIEKNKTLKRFSRYIERFNIRIE